MRHFTTIVGLVLMLAFVSNSEAMAKGPTKRTTTVRVKCNGQCPEHIKVRFHRGMLPQTRTLVKASNDWLRFGLRFEGSYAQFQGPQDNRDIWSSDIFGVLQFPHFLGPLGFEASLGGGGSFFPNDDTAFHGIFEAGPVFDMGRYFQIMAGYRAELGTVTNMTVLQRHAGVARLRWIPVRSFAVEVMFSPGWGLQVSESTHEEWEGDEGWKVTDVHNHAGWTPNVALAVTWFIH